MIPQGYIVEVFKKYIAASGLTISAHDFAENLSQKMNNRDFLHDTDALVRSEVNYDPHAAYTRVSQELLSLL